MKCCIKKITYFGIFVEVSEIFAAHFVFIIIDITVRSFFNT